MTAGMTTIPERRGGRIVRDAQGGFTLVELLVVLVILGLIMALVGPRVLGYLSSSRTRAASLQVSSFKSALDLYYLDVGRYPSKSEGLKALVERPGAATSWGGPYLQQSAVPADPWGNPYQYAVPGAKGPYRIMSFGADGAAGGAGNDADIVSD
jgi:general secretion pathway protein G